MATLAPITTPGRQPFGILNDSKIRSLQSVKNRQNAIIPNSAPSLKRRAVSPENSDSENVDPFVQDLMGKRKRTNFDDDVSLSKPSRYSLNTIIASKPRAYPSVSTPHLDNLTTISRTPASAPAAAGRSPTKPKRQGILGSKKRFAPPSFGIKSPALSITAALNGTLANKKPRKVRTIEESKPKSWFFDIFEESVEQQDYRMNEWTMTQSTTGLDLSEDESKVSERADRGKENVDPNEVSVHVTRSMAAATKALPKVSRKDEMTDEPRSPLSDLNPADYYADGLDATSVVLVPVDPVAVEPASKPEQVQSIANVVGETSISETDVDLNIASVGAVIMASTPSWDLQFQSKDSVLETKISLQEQSLPDDIEIWESESAKDENEDQNEEVTMRAESSMEENLSALQEL